MPNPFPGMNPYMEEARHWRGVHLRLIAGIETAINETLPRSFATYVEERIIVEEWDKEYIPDNIVVQRGPYPPSEPRNGAGGAGAVLARPQTVAAGDAPLLLEFNRPTTRQRYLEIRTVGDEELIAVIEVLSPMNKAKGSGWDEYRRKQRDLLDSGVHLLEIDLLRDGEYTVAPPGKRLLRRTGPFDYIISLHRGGAGDRYEVWPRTVRDRLPRVVVPLTEEAGDVSFDLQAVIDRSYDESGMERRIHYRAEPIPPLTEEDAVWADALLKEKGLR